MRDTLSAKVYVNIQALKSEMLLVPSISDKEYQSCRFTEILLSVRF